MIFQLCFNGFYFFQNLNERTVVLKKGEKAAKKIDLLFYCQLNGQHKGHLQLTGLELSCALEARDQQDTQETADFSTQENLYPETKNFMIQPKRSYNF